MNRQFALLSWPRQLCLALIFCAWAAGAWAQSFGVNLVAPTNGQFFSRLPADISLTATLTNAAGAGVRVEFYGGTQLLGAATNEPYTVVWTNASSGTNVIRAVAYAEGGGAVTSAPVTIQVNFAPTVALTAPEDQGLIGLGSNLVMVAAAADPAGAVGVVYFYVNAQMAGSLENPPYQWAVSNLVMGDYVLTAVAEDNWGVRSTSGPVRVSVIVPDAGIIEDFERGVTVGSWSEFAGPLGTDVLATNYGGTVSGTNALWFGGDDERYAATRPLALRAGATVEFWLRISGGNGGNWNLAELPDEGVVLEYANDGVDWKSVAVFDTYVYTNWQRVSLALPLEALGTNTVLRWRQPLHSGVGYSHWAVDDVVVMPGPTEPVLLQSPQSQSVTEGDTVMFSAFARGSEPLVYQWRANGNNIPGATSPTLTFSNVTLSMSGWNIAVVVTNDFGSTNANAGLTVRSKSARVAVYDHPSIVDTAGGNGAESDTVQAGLSNLNNVVMGTFTNLQTAGLTNDILWFPEFEVGDLAAVMTAADRQALSTFVGNGGLLVIHGSYASATRCQNFLNQVFGFSVQVTQTSSTVVHPRTAAAGGTAFATATNSLLSVNGSDTITTSSLPPGSLSIYELAGQSLVAILPAGKGKVIFLGYDWYDARPIGSQDAGWLTVMACAVLELAPTGALPPGIFTHPAGQRTLLNGTVTLAVGAYGSLPLAFQWQLNGTNLPAATNATLILNNVTLSQAGNYRVVVTNVYGSMISSNALLEVVELTLDTFQITALGTNNAKVVDHNSLTGDDRSGIAASSTRIFYSGDSSTARYRLEDLTEGAGLGRVLDGMVSDLRTEQVYVLANGSTPITGAGTITTLLEMDGDTGALTGNQITLSPPITTSSGAGVFAGYGQVVIHNGTRVYTILLPSGTVLDLGAMTMPSHVGTEGWAYWGVAEYFGGRLYLAYVGDYRTIGRVRVPDAATTTIATFNNLSDMAAFTVVPGLNRWYFHYEGSGQFGGSIETIGYANATFNYTPNPVPPVISVQPADRITAIGGSALFSVSVYGSRPLVYQWQREGTNLPGATNAAFYLTNLTPAQAGGYRVVVSNVFGMATSAVASLEAVAIGAGMFDDFEPGIDYAQWAAFSGIIGSSLLATNYGGSISPGNALWINNSESRFAVTRALNTTAGGTVGFYLRLGNGVNPWELVDLPAKGIVLEYSTNGTAWTEMGRYDTTNYYSWTRVEEAIPPAAQGTAAQFRWRQLSNLGTSYDHWALDDVLIATGPTPPALIRPPQSVIGVLGGAALLSVSANGSWPLQYQWQFEDQDLLGATNAVLILDRLTTNQAGNYRVIASNSLGAVTSVVAALTVEDVGDGLYDDFEPGIDLAEWAEFTGTPGSTVLATNFGGSVSAGNALLVVNSNIRYAATRPLNTTGGGMITFYLRLGFGAAPWETVELPAKGVVLEYSTNNLNWVILGRYDTPDFYTWTQVATNLPPDARGPAVQFRWRQPSFSSSTAYDHWALDEVFIAVGPSAPTIYKAPQDYTAAIGGSVYWTASATGSRPLGYQWQFEEVDLPGATNAVLWLSDLATNQAGNYRVVVTNAQGAATSAVASLTLLDVGAGIFDDFEPGVDPAQWSSFGGVVGTTVLATNYGGSISPSNSMWFSDSGSRFAATRPLNTAGGGIISFHLRLASGSSTTWETVDLPSKGIVLEYSTNGTTWTEMGRYNTTAFYASTQVTTNIPAAAQGDAVQFRWRQLSHTSSIYYDHWVLDDVIIATGPAAPAIVLQPTDCVTPEGGPASITVGVSGSLPLAYQWRREGVDLPGATNAVLVFDHATAADLGQYSVAVSNLHGSAVSSNAALLVLSGGIVGYYTDNNISSTGAYAVIERAGMVPVRISNIDTFDFSTITCLMLNENYYSVTTPLQNRLADIQNWVSSGGTLIVHDQSFSRALAVGSTNLNMIYSSTSDLGVVPPADTIVTRGPFGQIGDASLDGISPYGYVTRDSLPAGGRAILCRYTYTNEVVAFSYPLGDGHVYYSPFNLDNNLSGYGSDPSRYNATNIYTPNVLIYMQVLATVGHPPRILRQPANLLVAAGAAGSNSVWAIGNLPLHYQWLRNGTNVAGATDRFLAISDMSREQSGYYSVVVTNAFGAVTSSPALLMLDLGTITNRVPVFGITNTWKYNQTATDLGTAWRQSGYNDTAWPSGRGLLAFEDNSAITPYINTTLSLTNASGTRITTHYFRSWLNMPAFPGNLGMQLVSSNLVDDGAVFYLNGTEQGRLLFASGITVQYYTYANNSATENLYRVIPFTNSLPLTTTSNLLAVEVHQNTSTSSDVVFGMAMFADVVYPKDPPYINSSPVEVVVNRGQPFSISVNASSVLPMTYQWWLNGQRLALTQPTINVVSAQPFQTGVYQVVVSNLAGVVTSEVARVTVVSPPSIAQGPLTQELEVGSPLMLQVVCTGGALNYQWRRGGLALTGMTNAQLVVSNASVPHAGLYDVAVWNAMGAVTSVVAEVTFRGAYVPPPSFVLGNRALQLRFNAPAGVVYQVEASEDLHQWLPVGVVTNLTGTVDFLDYGAGKRAFRFYRLRAVP